MKLSKFSAILLTVVIAFPILSASAQAPDSDVADLRRLVEDMRRDYEARISDLESRLAQTERLARGAQDDADEAVELAEQTAIDQSSGTSTLNTYNPSIGVVMFGRYATVENGWSEIPGFQPAGEIGPGESGFSFDEAEINLNANIDSKFYGNLTLGVGEADVGIDEAWIQATGLPHGLTAKFGHFFSAAGYQNDFHFHADDFIDRPLPNQAFLGNRYSVKGVQVNWIAPTSLLFEIGSELNWGGGFPASANAESSPGAWTLFSKVGGDLGDSHSWQAGLSHTSADAVDRSGATGELFNGNSDLTIADFVWKWAPRGNSEARSVKIQGEYFSRSEDGQFAGIDYDGDQDGWYLQGVLQFARIWRVGLRHDVVDADNGALLAGTEIEDAGRRSYRNSLMFDWSPSEFSRFRLQYTDDNVLATSDQQWFLQYIVSIGAHGGHQF